MLGSSVSVSFLPFKTLYLKKPTIGSSALELLLTAYSLFKTWSPDLPHTLSPAFQKVTWELLHSVLFIKSVFINLV